MSTAEITNLLCFEPARSVPPAEAALDGATSPHVRAEEEGDTLAAALFSATLQRASGGKATISAACPTTILAQQRGASKPCCTCLNKALVGVVALLHYSHRATMVWRSCCTGLPPLRGAVTSHWRPTCLCILFLMHALLFCEFLWCPALRHTRKAPNSAGSCVQTLGDSFSNGTCHSMHAPFLPTVKKPLGV